MPICRCLCGIKGAVAMADVILVVLRRPEIAKTLLGAALQIAHLMGGARLNVLATMEPLQVTALGAEALMAEANSVLRAREQELQRVSALRSIYEKWMDTSGADARWAEVEGSTPTA